MRNTSTRALFSGLFISLFISGCQKDVEAPSSINAEIQSSDSRLHGKIRLAENSSEFGINQFEYNKHGLLKDWILVDFATYSHEYDNWGRLKKARVYDDAGNFTNTVLFFYNKKNQRYHEKWYDPSWNLINEVFYQFDHKGRGYKIESKMQGYKVILKWTNNDNLRAWYLYADGVLSAIGEYGYNTKLKNPFDAIPGLDIAYPFENGFFFKSKNYATTEDYYVYDENGKLIESYTQDPSKTVTRPGPAGYVASQDVFDNSTQSYVHFVFSYEKGKGGHHFEKCKNRKAVAWEKFKKRSGKPMKEKLRELRKEFKS